MRFTAATGHCVPEWLADIGFPLCATAAVSGLGGAFSFRPSSGRCRLGFIPSCVVPSPESLRLSFLRLLAVARPALGFLPSSRRYRWSPRFASVPVLALFRPQAFATSRRLPPPPASRACFIPQPRPGFPYRGLVPTRSRAGSSPARAPLPLSRACSPVTRLPQPRNRASRLCSTGRGERRSQWLAFVDAAPLFGFSSSRLSRPHRAATPLQCSGSAHGLRSRVFTVALPRRCSPHSRPSACQRLVRWWLVSEFTHLLEVRAFRRALRSSERRSRRRGVHDRG
jgi:hypothetical protein